MVLKSFSMAAASAAAAAQYGGGVGGTAGLIQYGGVVNGTAGLIQYAAHPAGTHPSFRQQPIYGRAGGMDVIHHGYGVAGHHHEGVRMEGRKQPATTESSAMRQSKAARIERVLFSLDLMTSSTGGRMAPLTSSLSPPYCYGQTCNSPGGGGGGGGRNSVSMQSVEQDGGE